MKKLCGRCGEYKKGIIGGTCHKCTHEYLNRILDQKRQHIGELEDKVRQHERTIKELKK